MTFQPPSHDDVRLAQEAADARDDAWRRAQEARAAADARQRAEIERLTHSDTPVTGAQPKRAQTPVPTKKAAQRPAGRVSTPPPAPSLPPGSLVLSPEEVQALDHLLATHPDLHLPKPPPPATETRF